MKKVKKFFGVLLKVILIGIAVFFVGKFAYQKYTEHAAIKNLRGSMEIFDAKAYEEEWANTTSDITGMTLLDKYNAGLMLVAGSDTDGDGLTDKEEIETYGSNPLSISTAGDLYSDSYKVANGMDVNTYCEYTEEMIFQYNECEEVSLVAEKPTDFNAVVKRLTNTENISGQLIRVGYQIYNYSGKMSVDLSSVITEQGISLSDLSVYISNGKDLKKASYSTQGSTVTIKNQFSEMQTYYVYFTEKDFLGSLQVVFGNASAVKVLNAIGGGAPTIVDEQQEVVGTGLVVCSPLVTYFLHRPLNIYYENLGNAKYTDSLKNKMMDRIVDFWGNDGYLYHKNAQNTVSKTEIQTRYDILKKIYPTGDATGLNDEDMTWKHVFFAYEYYEVVVKEPSKGTDEQDKAGQVDQTNKEEQQKVAISGFDYTKDTLPFGNFKSEYGQTGNCAGISYLTAYLYNKKAFPTKGSYKLISWNLKEGAGNETLLNPGLSDYKTSAFVNEHIGDKDILNANLTSGEQEFVKMIAAFYKEGNQRANFVYTNLYGGPNAKVVYDYSLIDTMKDYLKKGKILNVYVRMVDGTGHAMNIYGYEQDPKNYDVVWFDVYDSNFPQNETGDQELSEMGFRMRVERKVNLAGDGWTFSYDYFPIQNEGYGTTSNYEMCEHPFIIVLDEELNMLND